MINRTQRSCPCIIKFIKLVTKKRDKMLGMPHICYLFSPTCLINSIKHEHSMYDPLFIRWSGLIYLNMYSTLN